jgi:hypothetical protein
MARPKDIFLVAQYIKVPKDKSKTRAPGYMTNDENISYTENVTVTRGLKDRDLTAAVILNLTQKTVHKFRFEGKNDWETLAAYYAKGYPQYLKLLDPPEPTDEEVEKMAAKEVPVEEEEAKPKAAKKKRKKKEATVDE